MPASLRRSAPKSDRSCAPGQTVVTVARPDIREAVIDVADDLASALRIGMPLVVLPAARSAIRAEGKVREIAPQSDAADAQPPGPHHPRCTAGDLQVGDDHHDRDPGRSRPRVSVARNGDPHEGRQVERVAARPGYQVGHASQRAMIPNADGSVAVTSGHRGRRARRDGRRAHLKEGQKVRIEEEVRHEVVQSVGLGARARVAGLVFHDRLHGRRACSPISSSGARKIRTSPSRP